MPTVLIVYHSKTGNTEEMAKAVEEGVRSQGLKAIRKKVSRTTPKELLKVDGIILGSPNYYGTMAAEMKAFLDKSVQFHAKARRKGGGSLFFRGSSRGRRRNGRSRDDEGSSHSWHDRTGNSSGFPFRCCRHRETRPVSQEGVSDARRKGCPPHQAVRAGSLR